MTSDYFHTLKKSALTLGVAIASASAALPTYASIAIFNEKTGELLESSTSNEVSMVYANALRIKVNPAVSSDKLRLEPQNTECGSATQTDERPPFEFTINPMSATSICKFKIVSWKNPWRWTGQQDYSISFEQADPVTPDDPVVPVDPVDPSEPADPSEPVDNTHPTDKVVWTIGSNGKSDYVVGDTVPRSNHGNRIYCTVSHFSYDDPIIYPGQPGKAHLHMFMGNTETDAYSNQDSIPTSGKSSCLGGTNYRSGLWIPALFNDKDEAVVPSSTFIYYKTFMAGNAYNLLQVVPQGLEVLASKMTLNGSDSHFKINRGTKDGKPNYNLIMHFPSCVATTNGTRKGNPILSYRDMPGKAASVVNSHVAYPGGPSSNEVECPSSHPYRFPTPQLIINFDANAVGNNPYLASDAMNNAAPMSTLHADYIFGMDESVNEQVLKCAKESRTCNFGSVGALPERFFSEDGTQLYRYNTLLPEIDRTPFGSSLKPMKMNP
ncbi:DUF1996 domain-containing protein [Ketobacter sp.]